MWEFVQNGVNEKNFVHFSLIVHPFNKAIRDSYEFFPELLNGHILTHFRCSCDLKQVRFDRRLEYNYEVYVHSESHVCLLPCYFVFYCPETWPRGYKAFSMLMKF